MNKTRSHLHMFKKFKLIHRCFKSSPSIYTSWIDRENFLHFFGPVRFASSQLTSSPPFFLLGATSPPANVVTPSRHATLPFYWAKMTSLPPLHLPVMFCPIASPLETKLKHWIRITAAGYPPQNVWLSPFTAIKRSYQSCLLSPSLEHVSILSSP
jgi:hypothetical protein